MIGLLDENGKIMKCIAFTVKLSINCNILLDYKVIKAIPKEWLIEIEQFVHQNKISIGPNLHCYKLECNDFAMDIHKASTKAIYKCFIKFKYQTPVALRKWENIIQTTSDWHQIFKLPYYCARETQLQSLQYCVIHRFLPCRGILYRQYQIGTKFSNFHIIVQEKTSYKLYNIAQSIIHRFLPCKKCLCDISIVNSNMCDE